jgi:hypothetical protein
MLNSKENIDRAKSNLIKSKLTILLSNKMHNEKETSAKLNQRSSLENENQNEINNDTIFLRNISSLHSNLKSNNFNSSKAHKISKEIKSLFKEFDLLKCCQSKSDFHFFVKNSSKFIKKLLEFYVKECFIFHVFSRKLKAPKHLFSKRNLLFKILKSPSILKKDCGFNNNSISNFCTGACLFLKNNLKEIVFQIKETYS